MRISTGAIKIAIKVIDQTGMEHMTVIDDPNDLLQKNHENN